MTWRYQGCSALEKDNGLGIGLDDTVTRSWNKSERHGGLVISFEIDGPNKFRRVFVLDGRETLRPSSMKSSSRNECQAKSPPVSVRCLRKSTTSNLEDTICAFTGLCFWYTVLNFGTIQYEIGASFQHIHISPRRDAQKFESWRWRSPLLWTNARFREIYRGLRLRRFLG